MQDHLRQDALTRTSIHEAGHVVVAVLHRRRLQLATVRPEGASLGRVVFLPNHLEAGLTVDVRDDGDVAATMAILLAGFAGEVLLDRETDPWGCEEDIWRAYLAGEAAGRDREFFVGVMQRTVLILKKVWPCLLTVAAELRRRGTVDGLSLRRLVQRELGLRRRWRRHGLRLPCLERRTS
jgi:hypothetical protein